MLKGTNQGDAVILFTDTLLNVGGALFTPTFGARFVFVAGGDAFPRGIRLLNVILLGALFLGALFLGALFLGALFLGALFLGAFMNILPAALAAAFIAPETAVAAPAAAFVIAFTAPATGL